MKLFLCSTIVQLVVQLLAFILNNSSNINFYWTVSFPICYKYWWTDTHFVCVYIYIYIYIVLDERFVFMYLLIPDLLHFDIIYSPERWKIILISYSVCEIIV